MNRILQTLLIISFFAIFSCNKNDEDMQDYTSFIVENNSDIDMPNCVAGYQKGGLWTKIAVLGDLNIGDRSPEIKLKDFISEDIYIFTDYVGIRRIEVPFKLSKNVNNVLTFPTDFRGKILNNKSDPQQYPQ